MPSYKIVGNEIQAVVCEMQAGEAVIAEAGHLLTMTQNMQLDVSTGGGFLSGLKRAIGGSSFFVNHVSAQGGPGQVAFSSPTPGHILELDISAGNGWMCQPHVFLCGDSGLEIGAGFTQKLGAGLFGGTGFILQSLKGQGKAFVHVGGAALKYELQAGQSLRVATGSLVAFKDTVTYDIQMVRGLRSILFSGEGLWFAHLTGPGTVVAQSLSLAHLANSIAHYIPSEGGGGTSIGGAGTAIALGGLLGTILSGDE